MTSHPLPDTPSHQVLMQIAYGDHQVSMYAAAVQARTIGASAYQPALDLSTNRRRDRNLFYGIPTIRVPVQRLGDRGLGQRSRVRVAAAAGQRAAGGDQDRRPAGPARERAGDPGGDHAEVRLPGAQRADRQRLRRPALPDVGLHALS